MKQNEAKSNRNPNEIKINPAKILVNETQIKPNPNQNQAESKPNPSGILVTGKPEGEIKPTRTKSSRNPAEIQAESLREAEAQSRRNRAEPAEPALRDPSTAAGAPRRGRPRRATRGSRARARAYASTGGAYREVLGSY